MRPFSAAIERAALFHRSRRHGSRYEVSIGHYLNNNDAKPLFPRRMQLELIEKLYKLLPWAFNDFIRVNQYRSNILDGNFRMRLLNVLPR